MVANGDLLTSSLHVRGLIVGWLVVVEYSVAVYDLGAFDTDAEAHIAAEHLPGISFVDAFVERFSHGYSRIASDEFYLRKYLVRCDAVEESPDG